jgi:hypothetical protein
MVDGGRAVLSLFAADSDGPDQSSRNRALADGTSDSAPRLTSSEGIQSSGPGTESGNDTDLVSECDDDTLTIYSETNPEAKISSTVFQEVEP